MKEVVKGKLIKKIGKEMKSHDLRMHSDSLISVVVTVIALKNANVESQIILRGIETLFLVILAQLTINIIRHVVYLFAKRSCGEAKE